MIAKHKRERRGKAGRAPLALRAVTPFLGVLAAAVLVAAVSIALAERPVSADEGVRLFSVPRGSSLVSIAMSLEREGLVRSAKATYLRARLAGSTLKAGTFELSPSWPTSKIVSVLEGGKEVVRRVTVPEGLSLTKTARHFERSGVVDAAAFIAAARDPALLARYSIPGESAEGYLFPDTYFVPYNAKAEELVSSMIENFFKKTADIPGLPSQKEDLFRVVILASIVEREYRIAEEAPQIAGVFANRLKIGMGLQSCATVEYIITELQGKPHPTRLLTEDLAIPSDYNTYLWAGLPPGPISNPGRVALSAAAEPRKSPYLYFRLIDPETGRHTFTHNLDEHVEAGRSVYLKKAAGN